MSIPRGELAQETNRLAGIARFSWIRWEAARSIFHDMFWHSLSFSSSKSRLKQVETDKKTQLRPNQKEHGVAKQKRIKIIHKSLSRFSSNSDKHKFGKKVAKSYRISSTNLSLYISSWIMRERERRERWGILPRELCCRSCSARSTHAPPARSVPTFFSPPDVARYREQKKKGKAGRGERMRKMTE
jgi:hypothetical protein